LPRIGQKGGGIVEIDTHRNIRKYLDRPGSYTSSGRGADYRAGKEMAKADPSLTLEETLRNLRPSPPSSMVTTATCPCDLRFTG
jgi:hypothetical protein